MVEQARNGLIRERSSAWSDGHAVFPNVENYHALQIIAVQARNLLSTLRPARRPVPTGQRPHHSLGRSRPEHALHVSLELRPGVSAEKCGKPELKRHGGRCLTIRRTILPEVHRLKRSCCDTRVPSNPCGQSAFESAKQIEWSDRDDLPGVLALVRLLARDAAREAVADQANNRQQRETRVRAEE